MNCKPTVKREVYLPLVAAGDFGFFPGVLPPLPGGLFFEGGGGCK